MIPSRPLTPVAPPEADYPEGPSELITFTDLDFNLGPDDTCSHTLLPGDTLESIVEEGVRVWRIVIAPNERLGREAEEWTIDPTRVRWWSKRERTVALPPQPIRPTT